MRIGNEIQPIWIVKGASTARATMDANENLLRRLNQGLTAMIGGLVLIAGGAAVYLYGPALLKQGQDLRDGLRLPENKPPQIVFEYKPVIPEGGYQTWTPQDIQGISDERMQEINHIMVENAARHAVQDADRANRYSHGQFP